MIKSGAAEIKHEGGKSMADKQEYKVTWKGWLSLIILIISFSGIFTKSDTVLRALDFQVLTG